MAFKEFQWSCFWEGILGDLNFSTRNIDNDDEMNYENEVSLYKRMEVLKISRGDTLALRKANFV